MLVGYTSTASITALFLSADTPIMPQRWQKEILSPNLRTGSHENKKLCNLLKRFSSERSQVSCFSHGLFLCQQVHCKLKDFFHVSCSRRLQKPPGLQCTNNGRKAASNNTPRQWSCHYGTKAKYRQGFKWNWCYLYTLEGSRVPNLAAWVFILLVAPPLEQWG